METLEQYLLNVAARYDTGTVDAKLILSTTWPLIVETPQERAYFTYGPDYPENTTLYTDQVM